MELEDDSFLFEGDDCPTHQAGKYCPEAAKALERKIENDKNKLHEEYDAQIRGNGWKINVNSEKFEKKIKKKNEQSKKELQEAILDAYTVHDLYWCKTVWDHKHTGSNQVYFPCAKVPRMMYYMKYLDEKELNNIDKLTAVLSLPPLSYVVSNPSSVIPI